MSIQHDNAELIKQYIEESIELNEQLKELNKDLDFTIYDDAELDRCYVNIGLGAHAECYADGDVWLLNNPSTQPYVGQVYVLPPLDRESFLLGMLYLADLNALYQLRIMAKNPLPTNFLPKSNKLLS